MHWTQRALQQHQREVRVLLVSAVAVLVIDQAGKLAARGFSFGSSVQNTSGLAWWAWLVGFLVLADVAVLGIITSRTTAIVAGLAIGAFLADALDAVVWPGGVPEFIRISGGSVVAGHYNIADICLFVAVPLLVAAAVVRLLTAARNGWSIAARIPGRPGAGGA
jgi:hypothetical protein